MKKIIFVYILLMVAVGILAVFLTGKMPFNLPTFTSASVKIGNKSYSAIIAKSDKDRMKGLSGRNSLDKNTGMLFVFDKKAPYPFWMKDMKFPIDIIYIDDNKIVDIFENVPAPQKGTPLYNLPVYKPKADANYVFEINAGQSTQNSIKIGDTVTFKGVK